MQILATPKLNRRKELDISSLPKLGPDLGRHPESAQIIPASSASKYMPSETRSLARVEASNICKATPASFNLGRDTIPAVQGTPCRDSTQSRIDFYNVVPPSSPLQSRNGGQQYHLKAPCPAKVDHGNFRTPSKSSSTIQATPLKGPASSNVENEDPIKKWLSTPLQGGSRQRPSEDTGKTVKRRGEADSIYQALGWDDFDDV